jgi:hypothetical protein
VDAALLHLLWPRGCPPDDLTELLGIVTDPPTPEVTDWLAAQLAAVTAQATVNDPWLGLAGALSGHPILGLLPAEESTRLRDAVRVLLLLGRARADGPWRGPDGFTELFREYSAAGPGTREMLEREIPVLLAGARPLGVALRHCPPGLAEPFCLALRDWLAPARADSALAREVFTAGADAGVLAQPALSVQLMAAFEQVRQWDRRDLSALAKSMDDDAALARSFRRWWKGNRGGAWRLLGSAGPSGQEK